MKITNQIHYIEVETYTLPPHNTTNCYIIGDNNSLIIDVVYEGRNSLAEYLLNNKITSLRYAAITHPHPDHYNGVNGLINRFGGEILCHEEAAGSLSTSSKKIKILSGDEVLKIGGYTVKIIHTPGHSPGHLCFYVEEPGILFSGDTILGSGTSIISPPEGDMTSYMNSLRKLSELDVKMICPGHGPIISKYASEWINWYIDHRLMREGKIVNAMKSGISTLNKITERIYTEEDFQLHGYDLLPRAERSVLAHLIKLEKDGIVLSRNSKGTLEYFLA